MAADHLISGLIKGDEECISVATSLIPDAWPRADQRAIAEAARSLRENREIIDVISLSQRSGFSPSDVGALVEPRPSLNPKRDAQIVQQDWHERQFRQKIQELQSLPPHDWAPAIEELKRSLSEPADEVSGFRLTLLADLLKEPPEQVVNLVEGLLPARGTSLIVAPPKAGKTTLARNLALAVATGSSFLGRATIKGPVVYLALEEKRSEVIRHFLDLGATGEEEIYVHCACAPKAGMAGLEKLVRSKKPALVIVDTLFKLIRVTNLNDYAEVSAALEPLITLARESGAHLFGVHHSKRGRRRAVKRFLAPRPFSVQ